MLKHWPAILYSICCLSLPLLASAWAFGPEAMKRTFWSQEAAGWAQAFGTVAAVLGSFALLERQRGLERRDALIAAGRLAVDAMNRIEIHAEAEGKLIVLPEDEFFGLTSIRIAMEALPLGKLPPDVLEAFAAFTSFARETEQRLSELRTLKAQSRKSQAAQTVGPSDRKISEREDDRQSIVREIARLSPLAFHSFRRLGQRLRLHGVDVTPWRSGVDA